MKRERTGDMVKWIGTALILLLLLAGCGKANEEGDPSSANQLPSAGAADNSGSSPSADDSNGNTKVTTITATDSTGASLELPANVERVACLTEICVDSLAELGLEPVAVVPSSIAFEPEFYGERASSFVQIGGGFMEPSLEDIAKASPDVVVGLKGTHDMLRDGLQSIAPLYIAELKTYEDSIAFLEMLGEWTGQEEAAAAAKKKFLDKIDRYKQQSPNDRSALILYGADSVRMLLRYPNSSRPTRFGEN
ncbi:ABC transporter substrate-binding protein [Paenibacillaceae bacterium WGS1546]|uniref:ABC transporter substrate-binding protein n=1 Tax=Cohnella sp. WGS1546 TaxID=3366810 RepID=UPI00372D3F05